GGGVDGEVLVQDGAGSASGGIEGEQARGGGGDGEGHGRRADALVFDLDLRRALARDRIGDDGAGLVRGYIDEGRRLAVEQNAGAGEGGIDAVGGGEAESGQRGGADL